MKSIKKLWWSVQALAVLASAAVVSACGGGDNASAPPEARIKHVFIITLENKDFADSFGTSTQDPYLQSLTKQGALLTNYYGTGHVSLDNYISMMSGQPSTQETEADCFAGFNNVVSAGYDSSNPLVMKTQNGKGCVYPAEIKTLANQLDDIKLSWKGYMGDMGNDPTRESATCGHPKVGTIDNTQQAEAPTAAVPNGDQYASRHDPFVYFHSIIDDQAYCDAHVVNLDANLQNDLKSVATTPNLVFITPNLCDDGHDGDGTGNPGKGCVTGAAGGLTSINAFLSKWIPLIQASPAYQQDGLIIINFDEAGAASSSSGGTTVINGITTIIANETGASCCGQVPGPNVTRPGDAYLPLSATVQYDLHYIGVGGDRTGAVMLSKWIAPGTVSSVPYNHYSMLKSLELIFQTNGFLGYANDPNLSGFGLDVYTNLN